MRSKTRILISSIALSAIMATATPAAASGIPVINPTELVRIKEIVSTATKQLATAKQQLGQIQQMRNTIGQVGKGQIGSILQSSGLDFSGASGLLQDVRTISQGAGNLGSFVSNLKVPGEGGINIPSTIDTIDQGRQAAGQLFYYNGSNAMSQEQVAGLRVRRQSVLRETAVTSYGAATALRSGLEESRQVAEKLAEQSKNSPDLRTDVQISTAVNLAMYAELQKQTSMSAQLLELESARTLAGDATGRRSAN